MTDPTQRASLFAALAATLTLAACGAEPTPPETIETIAEPALDEQLAEPVAPPRPRGLWVLCEGSRRVLDAPARIETLLEDARRLGATDLFVQVYRGGRAWFDSTHADASPFEAIRDKQGLDTLAWLIDRARDNGFRVHAWVNVLSLAGHRDVPILRTLGRDAVLVDQRGRSILDYPKLELPEPDRRYYRMGTPAVWLDPASPAVAEYLAATFRELAARYPDLDGIHLDYIRYPGVLPFAPGSRFGVGIDFGYSDPTRARFRAETGLEAPFGDSVGNANRWDAWKRDKLAELVAGIRDAVRAVRPAIVMSAAVGSYAERVYLAESQDWQRWLEDGLIDLAIPMAYTKDDRLFRYFAERFSSGPKSDRIWIGQGSWLFSQHPDRAVGQLETARAAGATGEVLFSYDSIADAPELFTALSGNVGGD